MIIATGERMDSEYILNRSKRKTVSLQVGRDLSVVVRAPLRMPRAEIDRFVAQHQGWIEKHRARLAEAARHREAFAYADGDAFPFCGDMLRLATGEDHPAVREGLLLLPPRIDRPRAVAEFLREVARERARLRIAHFAPELGVQPRGVKITSAQTRWGSCSGKNNLCFSWRTACLPDELFDYIVVHELAHIREHNHSARFWQVVGQVLPDWPQRRAALRRFQGEIPF